MPSNGSSASRHGPSPLGDTPRLHPCGGPCLERRRRAHRRMPGEGPCGRRRVGVDEGRGTARTRASPRRRRPPSLRPGSRQQLQDRLGGRHRAGPQDEVREVRINTGAGARELVAAADDVRSVMGAGAQRRQRVREDREPGDARRSARAAGSAGSSSGPAMISPRRTPREPRGERVEGGVVERPPAADDRHEGVWREGDPGLGVALDRSERAIGQEQLPERNVAWTGPPDPPLQPQPPVPRPSASGRGSPPRRRARHLREPLGRPPVQVRLVDGLRRARPRSSAGLSEVRTTSGTRASCASTTAGANSTTAVPEVAGARRVAARPGHPEREESRRPLVVQHPHPEARRSTERQRERCGA